VLFKLAPDAGGMQIAAFLAGGPFGIISSMWVHERIRSLRISGVGKEDA